MKVYTVSQINSYIRRVFDNDPFLSDLYIEAEISNFKLHSAGHMYFTLKDSGASISAVMFRSDTMGLKFMPESGMKVLVKGRISLYEKTGQYQIYVRAMEPAGTGALYMAYEQLKARLEKAGVFDNKYKRPIPPYPRCIAVITSPTGAAVRDIIHVAGRRNPNVEIVVVPVLVQGEGAASDIVRAIESVNKWGGADTIIVGRGGGSIEDLWAFNEEKVARAIFDSHIPVISAVGHETDFTIADFVADVRAATPSAAAEIAVPSEESIGKAVINAYRRISTAVNGKAANMRSRYNYAVSCHAFRNFEQSIYNSQIYTGNLYDRIYGSICNKIEKSRYILSRSIDNVENLSPLNIMKRGYSLVYDGKGNIVSSAETVKAGDSIMIRLDKGRIDAKVTETGE